MADDDEVMEPDDEIEELEEGDELDVDEIDVDEIDVDELDEDELADDDEFGGLSDEFEAIEEDDEEEAAAAAGPVRRSLSGDEDDDDEDLITPDDVEADLDTILKDRLVASDDEGNEDDEEPEDRSEQADRLQPKRADETLCSSCFLLVRQSAPNCPVGDDDCPLFS
jgi:hypothetical protein